MNNTNNKTAASGNTLEIIAFHLHGQEFCVRTTTIREIRGWGPSTPIPHAPADVIGVMNLRGSVIPIIDLAVKLGMRQTEPSERSAIIVAEVHGHALGLVVDRVSDILNVPIENLQPVPEISVPGGTTYSDGIIAQPSGMICLLNLEHMFEQTVSEIEAAA